MTTVAAEGHIPRQYQNNLKFRNLWFKGDDIKHLSEALDRRDWDYLLMNFGPVPGSEIWSIVIPEGHNEDFNTLLMCLGLDM